LLKNFARAGNLASYSICTFKRAGGVS